MILCVGHRDPLQRGLQGWEGQGTGGTRVGFAPALPAGGSAASHLGQLGPEASVLRHPAHPSTGVPRNRGGGLGWACLWAPSPYSELLPGALSASGRPPRGCSPLPASCGFSGHPGRRFLRLGGGRGMKWPVHSDTESSRSPAVGTPPLGTGQMGSPQAAGWPSPSWTQPHWHVLRQQPLLVLAGEDSPLQGSPRVWGQVGLCG